MQGQTNTASLPSNTFIPKLENYSSQDPVVCYAYNTEIFDDVDQTSTTEMENVYGDQLKTYCEKRWGKVAPGGAQVRSNL